MKKTVSSKYCINRTQFFCWTIVAIILLQNGPLGNMPIVLLILPLLTCGGRLVVKVGKCEKALLIYGTYLLAITLVHLGSSFDLKYSINLFVQYAILYVGLKFIISKVDNKILLIFLRNFGIMISVLCAIERLSETHIWAVLLGKNVNNATMRVVGIFDNSIVCGCYLLFTLNLVLVFPAVKKNKQILALVSVLGAIVLTQSRSTWIAVVCVTVMYWFKFHSNRINRSYFTYGLLLCMVFFVLSVVLRNNIFVEIIKFIYDRIRGSLEAGEGHIIRIENIINSFKYWKRNILLFVLGQGKNYGLVFMKNNPVKKFGTFTWDSAIDNQYITLIHETGVLGLVAVLYIVIVSVKRFIEVKKDEKIQLAASMCLTGNAVCLFFFEGFNYPVLVMFYLIFVMLSDMAQQKVFKLE